MQSSSIAVTSITHPSTTVSSYKSPETIMRSRANIGSACLSCRHRKRRCMGGHPCPPCASTNSPCCYETGLDRRRKVYNEKARAGVEFQTKLLDGLLRAIKSEHCERILDMVRANASAEDLAAEIDLLDQSQAAAGFRAYSNASQSTTRSSHYSESSSTGVCSSSSSPTITQTSNLVNGLYGSPCRGQRWPERPLPPFSELVASTSSYLGRPLATGMSRPADALLRYAH